MTPPPRRPLLLITAGLGLDGGGRAVVGRLLAQAGADIAADLQTPFDILDLETTTRPRLALAAWRRQLLPGRTPRPAILYDLLGLARLQAVLPPALRSPYLLMLYGIEIWRPLGPFQERAIRHATHRVGISDAALARAAPYLPLPRTAFSTIPLALEERPPEGVPDRELLDRAGDEFLLIVGRMGSTERYKGHDQLLEALPELARNHPDPRLVIAGGGDDRPRLEAKAAALGVAGRTLFAGHVSEATLAELYRRCAIFAMPSRGEGFGLVYLEAMRAGKPVVALSGTAAAEIVVHGETGLLAALGDQKGLTAALAALLGDPERRRAMGQAGHERWREQFTYDRFKTGLGHRLDRLTSTGGS